MGTKMAAMNGLWNNPVYSIDLAVNGKLHIQCTSYERSLLQL